MLKTHVAASLDVQARSAFHLSNVPETGTEALTKNLTELPSEGIAKTGAVCAWQFTAIAKEAVRHSSAGGALLLAILRTRQEKLFTMKVLSGRDARSLTRTGATRKRSSRHLWAML